MVQTGHAKGSRAVGEHGNQRSAAFQKVEDAKFVSGMGNNQRPPVLGEGVVSVRGQGHAV
jgi:hypothetical protein